MNEFASTSTNAIIASILLLAPITRDTNNESSRINITHVLDNSSQKASSTLEKSTIIRFVQNSRDLRLIELSNLKKGWDGYHARPISKEVIRRTKSLLSLQKLPFNAELIPTGRGSIQIELSQDNSNYFELEIFYNKYSIYFEKNGQEVERDVEKNEIPTILKDFCS